MAKETPCCGACENSPDKPCPNSTGSKLPSGTMIRKPRNGSKVAALLGPPIRSVEHCIKGKK